MALEERFARRLRESCDDAAAAARRFEVRSVAVHQYVHDEVTGEARPFGTLLVAVAPQLGSPDSSDDSPDGHWVALRTQGVVPPHVTTS